MISNPYRVILFSVAIIIIAIAGALIFFPMEKNEANALKIELIKSLIELLLLVIVGGIVVQEFIGRGDLNKKRDELKKQLYRDLATSYNSVKKIRRIMEADTNNKDRPGNESMPASLYAIHMNNLITVQLEYEFHKSEMKWLTQQNTFKDKQTADKIFDNLGKMEIYLDNIGNLYQKNSSGTGMVDIASLDKLYKFIFITDAFRENFSEYHHSNLELFRSEILKG